MGSMPFPFFPLEVDKDAQLVNPAQLQAITNAKGFTDLFFMSHGWNNDMNDARNLYEGFFNQVDAALGRHPELGLNPAQFAVVGVFWPSKKFADRVLIPGNAASLGDLDDAADDAISKSIAQLQG